MNPWFFPSAERYKAELENVGFHVEYIESFSRPTPLTSGLGKWLNIFANSIVSNLTDYQRKKFLKEVENISVGSSSAVLPKIFLKKLSTVFFSSFAILSFDIPYLDLAPLSAYASSID